MRCLILAAGKGSRLWQRGNSKPLIPLLGIPLIERTIRSALEAGIDEFYVVSGYNGDQVRRFLDDLVSRCAMTITHVINNDWQKGNGLSVLAAKEYLVEPFVLLMADHLFDPSILHDLAAQTPCDGGITLAVDYNTANLLVDLKDVTRVRSENKRLMEIGKGLEKFNGFDTGIFLCTPAIFDGVEQSVAEDEDSSLSGGVRCLAARGRVNVFDISERRIASYTCRWIGTSLGASNPSRTLSPRISITITIMLSLMMMLSFFLRDNTSIACLLLQGLVARRADYITGRWRGVC